MDEIKLILKSLITSSAQALSVRELEKDFHQMEGYTVPYRKMGFESLLQFLRSLDGFRVTGCDSYATVTCAVSDKVSHIRKMVLEQKKKSSRGKKGGKKLHRNFSIKPPPYSKNPQTVQYTKRGYNSNGFNTAHRQTANKNSITTQYGTTTDDHRDKNQTFSRSSNYSDRNNFNGGSKYFPKPNYADAKVQNAKVTKSPYEDSSKRKPYQKPFETEKNTLKTNHPSIFEKTQAVSGNFNKQELDLTRSKESKDETNQNCKNVKHSAKCELPKTNSGALIEKPQITKAEKRQEAVPDQACTERNYLMDRVVPIVGSEEGFKESTAWSKLKKGSIIRIYVSEVHSPYKFWFRKEFSGNYLRTLTAKMESFYRNSIFAKAYSFPKSCIVPGRICAVRFGNAWNRANILTHPKDGTVKVFFVDYGTVDYVAESELKYLTQEFNSAPKQALRGSLVNIEPLGSHWSLDASLCFLNSTLNKLLTARIADINEKTRTIHLMLYLEEKTQTILINNSLVVQGHAKPDREWLQRKSPRRPHKREYIPSFELLESGDYPTLTGLCQYMANGVDFEAVVDEKIVQAYKLKLAKLKI